jgi:hypothetical protein
MAGQIEYANYKLCVTKYFSRFHNQKRKRFIILPQPRAMAAF